MSIIRKISVGIDYKSSMHYILGQDILGGKYRIHQIIFNEESQSYLIFIEGEGDIVLWKQFNRNLPVAVEFNINY
jgi:hypothetical protein